MKRLLWNVWLCVQVGVPQVQKVTKQVAVPQVQVVDKALLALCLLLLSNSLCRALSSWWLVHA